MRRGIGASRVAFVALAASLCVGCFAVGARASRQALVSSAAGLAAQVACAQIPDSKRELALVGLTWLAAVAPADAYASLVEAPDTSAGRPWVWHALHQALDGLAIGGPEWVALAIGALPSAVSGCRQGIAESQARWT